MLDIILLRKNKVIEKISKIWQIKNYIYNISIDFYFVYIQPCENISSIGLRKIIQNLESEKGHGNIRSLGII